MIVSRLSCFILLLFFVFSHSTFAQSGNGDLTIVSTGGDAEGTTWTYSNGVIQTISSAANILNTAIQAKLNSANLSIEANKVTFSANVTGSTSNSFSVRSKTHILNTNATTITTQGGNVLFASNVDDATDGESTTNGYIQLRNGITVNSNGGDITFGGGNTAGSDYAFGSSAEDYTEGVRFDGVISLNSAGGNISIKGKSYQRAVQSGWGASGVGFYFFSAATGTINSGSGTVSIDGFSQTNTSSYSSGFYIMNNLSITSSNTSSNAITITGKAIGASGEAWGIESEGTFSVIATGAGGGITVNTSKQLTDNYDLVLRAETNILAVSGPIQINTGQLSGTTNGYLYLNGHLYLGSKAASSVTSSSSNITLQVDRFQYFNGALPKIATSGTLTIQPIASSFSVDVYSSWFDLNQNSQTLSGFTFGKIGNAGNLYLNTSFTVAGPVDVYGGYIQLSGIITSSGNADIFFKGIANSGSSVNISGGITKSSGTGTLTMQANGRAISSGTISATGSAVLNLVMWSDFDGDNVGGGSTLNGGSISTNGGHVWLGGSNSNGGSYTWNGLTVGDGPSIGTGVSNCHAIDLFAPITTAGGDVLLWAGTGVCGLSGIQSDGSRHINAGSGDITFIAGQTGGAIELTSTGVIYLLPNAGSYPSALTVGGTLTTGNFTFNTSQYNGLKINALASSGLVIGSYSAHLNSGVSVAQGNTSNVTVTAALSTKSIEIYGGAISLNENMTTSGVNADMIIKATSNINLAASKTITTTGGDVNLWADSDDNSTGYVQLLASAAINSNGGDINLGGGSSLTSDYAFGTTAETCPEVTGTQYISGVHLRQSSSLSSNGGNITVRGQNVNTAISAMAFGISLRGVVMNSGTGKIALNGVATGSGSVNAQGVASWGTLTLRSANSSADAISINGNALSSVGSSSLGVNVVALFEATGAGGGIAITGKSGVASTNASVNLGGDILAVSGPITISGENASGIQDNIFMGSTTTIGKKSGTNVTTSSSNVILEGNRITASAAVTVDCSGTLTVQPFGNSFAAAFSWPMTNVTHAAGLTGLTIGKTTNTSDVTFANTTSISGPITAYGGAITVSAAVSAAGNILLDGDTGSFLSQNSKGVSVNAAVSTSNNGNIIILGRGGSTTGLNTHGINITNLLEAGGTGNIQLTGYGGLSFDNTTGSSCHGVNIEGANAWVKSNGGNITITGFGGGAGAGTYSQGVPVLTNAKVSSGGSGTITISGTGGVNTAIGLRGVIITTGSSIYSAGGAISITGTNGTNGSDNSDGLTLDNATIGSNASGAITLSGQAGGGTGSDAISMSGTNVIGGTTHANSILLRANNLALAGSNSVLTTGSLTIEPLSSSFTSDMSFPISNLSVANTLSGLTLGKTGNTANLTIGTATSVSGPITLYGGTLTLNGALTTTNTSTGNLSLYGTTLAGSSTITVANGRTLTLDLSSNTNYTGSVVGTGISLVKDGAGLLTLPTPSSFSFANLTVSTGGFQLNASQQLTLSGTLTNNGTLTLKDGATLVQGTSGTSITGTGTYNVEKALTGNSATWNSTSGRFWYMSVPMNAIARSSFGNYAVGSNRVWSYNEINKQYTDITTDATTLVAGTGYVHRRATDGTLTFTATGANGLFSSDFTLNGLTRTAGSFAGYHLIANPYMAYLDWDAVTKTNVETTFYIRSNNTNDISALISYNASTQQYTNTSGVSISGASDVRYIAPLQSIWVRVGTASSTGSLAMTRSMLSHQSNNPGLKNSTVFPTLARVNLVDGARFDQMLVFMNQDMSNAVDQYDSEKMFVSGAPQIYTMAAGKKLVMNGLKNNKKKISVPLYLELPESKVYNLQLAEYILEDGLILLEDKQEGIIQDFTIHDVYPFYANSGVLSNRFVLHFFAPDNGITAQGPSNSWVENETSYTEGGQIVISADGKGKVQITLDQPDSENNQATVQAVDANGRVVYSGFLEGLTTEIHLDVPSGVYYLTVQSGNLIEKKKVFIQE